ncbi:MAG: hypothetical protein ACSHX5_03995 [Phycisphaerales bacterium]
MNDSGRPVVMPEQPAESSVASNLAICYRRTAVHDRHVSNSLVRSFMVVVLDILADQVVKMLPANRDEVIQTLGLERFDPSLDVRIHQWRFDSATGMVSHLLASEFR